MKEEWIPITNYEDLYEISNFGRVKSLRRNKIIKGTINKGYNRICLTDKNKKEKNYFVHRLVVENFKRRIKHNENIDHIDCNKLNNRLDNLEIVSIDENNRRAFCNGLLKYQKRIKTPIYLIDDNDNILKEYDSINQAKNDLNICSSGHISDMLNGKRKTVEGYRFKAKPVSTRDVIVS